MEQIDRDQRIIIVDRGVNAYISVNGKEMKGVTGYKVTHEAGELPVVELQFKPDKLTLNVVVKPDNIKQVKD